MQEIWISPQIFEWESRVETSSHSESDSWRRAYAIWHHAEQLLENPDTQFNRIDVITTLKRSMDNRIRLLDKIYNFRKITIKDKPRGHLELLHHFRIIRSRMIQKLLDIRNALEHADAEPPSHEDCFEFLEFTWYFLRSTDLLARRTIECLFFDPPESENGYQGGEFNFSPNKDWIPEIRVWLLPTLISRSPIENWIIVKAEEINVLKDARAKGGGIFYQYADPEMIFIRGEMRGSTTQLLRLIRIYFETV
jgi:hypothetical protein